MSWRFGAVTARSDLDLEDEIDELAAERKEKWSSYIASMQIW
jgi:hypothetical protein